MIMDSKALAKQLVRLAEVLIGPSAEQHRFPKQFKGPGGFKATGQRYHVVEPLKRVAATTGSRKAVKTQYVNEGNILSPTNPIRLESKLPAGVYGIIHTMTGYAFERHALHTDTLLKFEDPTHQEILREMENFWARRDAFKQKGFLHRRAVLMFGPPGSGKSCIIKIAIDDLTRSGDIVFTCNRVEELREGLKLFREIEPTRRCLAIMEDVDELSEHSLLQLLDGTNSADHILYLATTNYINKLPERVLRPGRFDRKIEVPFPPAAGRRAYLLSKLQDEGLAPEELEALVVATRGFSFGHLREFITAAYCMGQPIETVLTRLRGIGIEETGNARQTTNCDVPQVAEDY